MEANLENLLKDCENPELETRVDAIRFITNLELNEKLISEQIIPKLTCLLDDSDEVIQSIIDLILKLKEFVISSEHIINLFIPLEILLDFIDDTIRKAAIFGILDLMHYYGLIGTFSVNFIEKIVNLKSIYSVYSAIEIIQYLFEFLSDCEKDRLLELLKIIYLSGTIFIRNQVAETVLILSKNLSNTEKLTEFVYIFFSDSEDFVRIIGLNLIMNLELDITEFTDAFSDRSWKIRYFLAKNISSLLRHSQESLVVAHYISYLNDSESEVQKMAYSNLENFCKLISTDYIEAVLEEVKKLENSVEKVTSFLALVIIRLGPIVGKDYSQRYLLGIIEKLFISGNNEIELHMIQELGNISAITGLDFIENTVLPVILNLLDSKTWKIKIEAISFLPKIGKDLGLEFFMLHLHRPLLKALNDLIHAVRKEAIKSISKLADIFSHKWVEIHILPEALERSKSDNYIGRITSINLIMEICGKIEIYTFIDQIFEVVERLAKDKIPNVRICIARLCRSLELLETNQKKKIIDIMEELKHDCDSDVRIIVSD